MVGNAPRCPAGRTISIQSAQRRVLDQGSWVHPRLGSEGKEHSKSGTYRADLQLLPPIGLRAGPLEYSGLEQETGASEPLQTKEFDA